MYRIHTPHGPILQSLSGSDVIPRQNILDIHKELFLFDYAKMLLHCQLRDEGMLSPYAGPFFPPTESITDNKVDVSQEQNIETEKNTNEIKTRETIDKEIIASALKRQKDTITLKEELDDDNEKKNQWIKIEPNKVKKNQHEVETEE